MNVDDSETRRLDLLGRSIPSGFEVQVVVLEPGCELRVAEAGWKDALIEVDDGEVELELSSGLRRRFRAGALLWLTGGRLRALPAASAVVIALWRPGQSRPGLGTARDEKSGDCRLNTHDDNRERQDHRPRA